MPIYEYECLNCKIKDAFVRGINDKDPGYRCKTCNLSLTRVYSNIGVTFSGSGFYSTDK